MSIPKEPRQLMINIMYLVLTAMLALNVSAEVMNAFFTLDDGNTNAINTVSSQIDVTQEAVNSILDDESKAKYRPIQPAIEQIRNVADRFSGDIKVLRDFLIDQAGNRDGEHVPNDEGDYIESHGHWVIKGKKDKDVTTRVLVDGYTDNQSQEVVEAQGPKLYENVQNTRNELIEVYTTLLNDHGEEWGLSADEVQRNIQAIANEMPFHTADPAEWQADLEESLGKNRPEMTEAEEWSTWRFRQLPLAAVLPLLSQMESNLTTSEAAMVNSMAELTGGRTIEFDAFFPVVQAPSAYVIGGERFTAEIGIGSYSSSLQPENVSISVNGQSLPINEQGKAEYAVTASGMGPKKLSLAVAVTNPLTGEVKEGEGEYTYEVGRRSVAVSADKMNVFYIGVDNPVTVSAAGVASGDVRVSASGPVNMTGSGSSYIVKPTGVGEATISVSARGQNLGSFPFRVKRIPDPRAVIGNDQSDGALGSGEFKAQRGVRALLEGFDFDARCDIAGFTLTYVPSREDPIRSNNPGPVFNTQSQNLVRRARPGDTYYFDNVRARCPGDPAARKINAMVFTIR
ncbi:MAG: GldM family protein [Bacteroidota bacterium]